MFGVFTEDYLNEETGQDCLEFMSNPDPDLLTYSLNETVSNAGFVREELKLANDLLDLSLYVS